MEHPTQHMLIATRFLDHVVDDYGVYLVAPLIWFLLGLLLWAVSRRNRPGEVRIHAILLPLGRISHDNQRLESPPESPPCDESDDQ